MRLPAWILAVMADAVQRDMELEAAEPISDEELEVVSAFVKTAGSLGSQALQDAFGRLAAADRARLKAILGKLQTHEGT
jgi:hypothetical protein